MVLGEYDFSLDQPINLGLGQYTVFAYYTFTNFFELKPKKLPAIYNVVLTFDKYIWGLTLTSLVATSFTLYFMYKKENEVIKHREKI